MLNPAGTSAMVSALDLPGVSVNTSGQSEVLAQSPGPSVGFKSTCSTVGAF